MSAPGSPQGWSVVDDHGTEMLIGVADGGVLTLTVGGGPAFRVASPEKTHEVRAKLAAATAVQLDEPRWRVL